jgi:glycine/sarcosine/betaine reductase complex component A
LNGFDSFGIRDRIGSLKRPALSEQIKKSWKGETFMENWLKDKIAIVVGERDGVQGPSIAKCLEAAGARVVYAVTECFV